MASHTASEMKLEIGHVLFIDIVGYSQLLITQQSEQIEALRRIVRGTAQFQEAEAEGKLLDPGATSNAKRNKHSNQTIACQSQTSTHFYRQKSEINP